MIMIAIGIRVAGENRLRFDDTAQRCTTLMLYVGPLR